MCHKDQLRWHWLACQVSTLAEFTRKVRWLDTCDMIPLSHNSRENRRLVTFFAQTQLWVRGQTWESMFSHFFSKALLLLSLKSAHLAGQLLDSSRFPLFQ